MQFRCKPGDLALVVWDTPPCIENVGRLVHVRGPVELNKELQQWCWLIKPVSRRRYFVETRGQLEKRRVSWISRVEHPDRWLLPIRDDPGLASGLGATGDQLGGVPGCQSEPIGMEDPSYTAWAQHKIDQSFGWSAGDRETLQCRRRVAATQ
jgi:hypothetical protein